MLDLDTEPVRVVAHSSASPAERKSYVTVQAKTSLVHTSKFATLGLYNFGWERSTELKFAMSVH